MVRCRGGRTSVSSQSVLVGRVGSVQTSEFDRPEALVGEAVDEIAGEKLHLSVGLGSRRAGRGTMLRVSRHPARRGSNLAPCLASRGAGQLRHLCTAPMRPNARPHPTSDTDARRIDPGSGMTGAPPGCGILRVARVRVSRQLEREKHRPPAVRLARVARRSRAPPRDQQVPTLLESAGALLNQLRVTAAVRAARSLHRLRVSALPSAHVHTRIDALPACRAKWIPDARAYACARARNGARRDAGLAHTESPKHSANSA